MTTETETYWLYPLYRNDDSCHAAALAHFEADEVPHE